MSLNSPFFRGYDQLEIVLDLEMLVGEGQKVSRSWLVMAAASFCEQSPPPDIKTPNPFSYQINLRMYYGILQWECLKWGGGAVLNFWWDEIMRTSERLRSMFRAAYSHSLRVQVPNNQILAQTVLYNYYYQSPKFPIIRNGP